MNLPDNQRASQVLIQVRSRRRSQVRSPRMSQLVSQVVLPLLSQPANQQLFLAFNRVHNHHSNQLANQPLFPQVNQRPSRP
jgi:hypothetical protein